MDKVVGNNLNITIENIIVMQQMIAILKLIRNIRIKRSQNEAKLWLS